jgi:diadenosine tetraphosphate (Ap4A) HIT family hydrolase
MTSNGESACILCSRATDLGDGWVYQEGAWLFVRPELSPIAGWIQVQSVEHIPDLAAASTSDAAAFGLLMRRVTAHLRTASGADRVYFATLSESVPHFHGHFVPRLPGLEAQLIGFPVFGLVQEVRSGAREPAAAGLVDSVLDRFVDLMQSDR